MKSYRTLSHRTKTYRTLMTAVLGLALAVPAFAWQSPAAPKAEAAAEKKTEATSADKKTEAAPEKTAKNDPKADITSKPAATVDPDYIIGVDDVLAVNVWREPELSRVVNVRPDGKVTLPLLGEFAADGQTPKMLEAAILKKLHHQPRSIGDRAGDPEPEVQRGGRSDETGGVHDLRRYHGVGRDRASRRLQGIRAAEEDVHPAQAAQWRHGPHRGELRQDH
jgi:hypothetical protein